MVEGPLAYALFTLFGSALTLGVNAATERFRTKARRTDVVYEKRVERLFELEELAGHLTEFLGSYRPLEADEERLQEERRRIERMSGSFRRYPDLNQAVRDFLNRTGIIISEGGRNQFETRQEGDEAVAELNEAFERLTEGIDDVLDRHGIYDLRE